MAWTYTWDATTPAGTDAMSTVDGVIREEKNATAERLSTEHYGLSASETDNTLIGHKYVRHMVQATDPTAVANCIITYGKDVGGYCELHAIDEIGGITQLTNSGPFSKVHAYQTVAQVLVFNTAAKITLTTEQYDTTGEFAASRFSAGRTGYYLVNGRVAMATADYRIQRLHAQLYKNGTLYKTAGLDRYYASTPSGGFPNVDISITEIIYLTSGDYIELYGFFSGSSSFYTDITATHNSFLQIHRIG